jgi:hypothetical protein
MPIIRDDDEERLARVEHVLEVAKKRRDEVSEAIRQSERICEQAASTREAARNASHRPDAKEPRRASDA